MKLDISTGDNELMKTIIVNAISYMKVSYKTTANLLECYNEFGSFWLQVGYFEGAPHHMGQVENSTSYNEWIRTLDDEVMHVHHCSNTHICPKKVFGHL